jgi:hypothetical protein
MWMEMWTQMWTVVWPLLGLSCVVWTSLGVMRLLKASRSPIVLACEPSRPYAKARRSNHRQRFAAWDERGRMIVVDDLGHH